MIAWGLVAILAVIVLWLLIAAVAAAWVGAGVARFLGMD